MSVNTFLMTLLIVDFYKSVHYDSPIFLRYIWRTVYWINFSFGFFVFPLLCEREKNPFSYSNIRLLARFYVRRVVIILSISVPLLVLIFLITETPMDKIFNWTNIYLYPVLINTIWGYILLILQLSLAFVNIPKIIIRSFSAKNELQYLYTQIGKYSHLDEEQQYLLPYKIKENKSEILQITHPHAKNKMTTLLKKFDSDLHRYIYKTEINKNNSVLNSLNRTSETLDFNSFSDIESSKSKDMESSKSKDEFAEVSETWNIETLEKELIRNMRNKFYISQHIERAMCIRCSFQKKLPTGGLSKYKSQVFVQKYMRHVILIILLILLVILISLLGFLLTSEFFELNRDYLVNFWASMEYLSFLPLFTTFIVFFLTLVVYGVLNTRFGYFAGLVPNNLTDVLSMNYFVSNISRVMPPLCLNIFLMFGVKHPQFNGIMIREEIMFELIINFNRYFPPLIFIFIIMKCFNCYERFRRCFGYDSFKIGDSRSNEEHAKEGKKIVDKFYDNKLISSID